MYEDNYQNQRQQDNNDLEQPLPEYGQVEGQKILMKGLDYSLLQRQKEQDSKKGFLENIKNKLNSMEKTIDSRTIKIQPKIAQQLDQQSIKLMNAIKQLQNIKPMVNSSTYYLFDTRFHFGGLKPQVITKRLGRMNKQYGYVKVNDETLAKFKRLLQKTKTDSQILYKQKAINKILRNEMQQESDSSSDNIFGSDDQQPQQMDKQQHTKLFNFGQKLNFGVKDQEIFSRTLLVQTVNPQFIDENKQLEFQKDKSEIEQKDKYDFLRKKVKKVTNQESNDGYGECYFQTGPTFDQMKQSRNQGIELWGDLKQFKSKKPDRKPNIGRQYGKVKRIIDEKYNKK